ncbi:hypothetical protein CT0861_04375 [Colletotrichum tofieldiae]|uniref:Uncharacterized protein n=1 Tax=Colletotrichum tofieldiae TaxID=708197 RepID=A0A166W730_9PEZI|nr:hypothetical protein CT0861_04375 [Colletotrichum tofieldiae]
MTDYEPACGVDREFNLWYRKILGVFEDPTTTDSVTEFFAPSGSLILGDMSVTGDQILEARGAILPADGSVQWNHFPNKTIVASETPTNKSFVVSGVLEITLPQVFHDIRDRADDANPSFQTLFTVEKNLTTGRANLAPQGGSLLIYHGFSINATDDPCVK